MKHLLLLLICGAACVSPAVKSHAQTRDYTAYVNPFTGTDAHGHTYPGASWPFGMMQLSPDTRLDTWDGCSGYHYSDSLLYGFTHTHLSGTGVLDYGDILLMPVTNYPQGPIDNTRYRSSFSHEREEARPGYYKVFLDKWDVTAELTVGRRAGMHRYTYPIGKKAQLIIDLDHRDKVLESRLRQTDARSLQGLRRSGSWAEDQSLYFYMEFSRDIADITIEDNRQAMVTFVRGTQPVVVRIGISAVSEQHARTNLYSGVKGFDFDALRKRAGLEWKRFLGQIEVESPQEEDVKTFYTCLYHSALAPCLYSDADGSYRGMDGKIHTAKDHEHYTVFSLWDTYRSLHPLMCIIEPERNLDFIRSFLATYDQSGLLPMWELAANETNCMIGYHAIPVIADAWAKGLRDFDKEKALTAMMHSANQNRLGIDVYRDNGLVLAEKEHESVSKTLEYAYDDACIAFFADALGHKDTAACYFRRAQFWKNQWDPQTGLMRPKIAGRWITPFEPREVNVHFTEANSWQYSFYVPHDVNTHIDMLGGPEAYAAKLDSLFAAPSQTKGRTQVDITGLIGQYAHGNEPSQQAAYLYVYAGQAWKTQERVRQVLRTLYSARADGLCGNDDCGQMSAWYVLSALGFYPVCPGTDRYIMGAPLFEKAVIHLKNGKDFTITAPGADNLSYVRQCKLNGHPYPQTWFCHADITGGGRLDFQMGSRPDTHYGTDPAHRPVARLQGEAITVNPWFEMESTALRDSMRIAIGVVRPDYRIYYALNDGPFQAYRDTFTVYGACTLRAYAQAPDGTRSFITETALHQVNTQYSVSLLQEYNPQYNAGGAQGLIDGVRGATNFRLGGWQGYQNTDFTAILDLGRLRTLTDIRAGFLQDARSWIWMPRYADFYISADGEHYQLLKHATHEVDPKDYECQTHDLGWKGEPVEARYIKVFAKNFGTIPAWHLGAGGEGFIFVDEIIAQ